MKFGDVRPGIFVEGKKNGSIREILCFAVPSGFRQKHMFYADEDGTGFCAPSTISAWAGRQVPQPHGWTRKEDAMLRQLRGEGRLPEQHGVAPSPEIPFSKERSDLARSIVYNAFRNTMIEDIHAGVHVPPGSKIVTPDGTEIPYEDASHISDEQMKKLMIGAVDMTYTILSYPHIQMRNGERWNDAKLDRGTVTALGVLGLFGDEAKEAYRAEFEALAAKNEHEDADEAPALRI